VQGSSGTGGAAIPAGPFVLVGGGSGTGGTAGTNGKGGGGGGGGGGGSSNPPPSFNADRGGGGGAGGAGGLGGNPGSGGAGGGAVEFVAVNTAAFHGSLAAAGGHGGDGATGQVGGSGGAGGAQADDGGAGGPGGKGGNGGAGGPGGGGSGGMIYISGSQVQLPSSLIELASGTGGTNSSAGVASPGLGLGLLKLEGTLSFGVTSGSSFDQLHINGNLDGPSAVTFTLANDSLAGSFSSTFTSDSFFPDIPFSAISGLDYSATSPSHSYDVTLNPDHTFTLTTVPEPSTIVLAFAGAVGLLVSKRRAGAIAYLLGR
jgi:hypothetical protein